MKLSLILSSAILLCLLVVWRAKSAGTSLTFSLSLGFDPSTDAILRSL